MGTEDNCSLRFQQTCGGGDSILNCPSSVMNTNPLSDKVAEMAMSSGSMFKSSSSGADLYLVRVRILEALQWFLAVSLVIHLTLLHLKIRLYPVVPLILFTIYLILVSLRWSQSFHSLWLT
ncbi:hypothetical protein CsSME_00035700 [Camellia sinensis var. sinensis]